MPGVRIVALCDADAKVMAREMDKVKDYGRKIETYTDVRKLLENKNVDAIVTATPNHWHALVTIWSCQAGKDLLARRAKAFIFANKAVLVMTSIFYLLICGWEFRLKIVMF